MDRTFSIIKPDATKRNLTGAINKIIEDNNLRIIAQKRIKLSKDQAKKFYSVHSEKSFFNELIDYMTSESVVVQILEGNNAVQEYRRIMGSTNPADAENNTIRKEYGLNVQENSVHGFDSKDNAEIEMNFFFKNEEIVG